MQAWPQCFQGELRGCKHGHSELQAGFYCASMVSVFIGGLEECKHGHSVF